MVYGTENQIASKAEEKSAHKTPPGQAYRVPGQVDTLESIHEGEPDRVAPSQVEPKVIMSDVDCAQVPRLIEEEVYDICPVQNIEENHRVADVAEVVILLGGERQVNQSPGDNPRPSVKEQFEIERANSRVVFNTHEEVVEAGSAEAPILGMTGKIVRLDVTEQRQAEAKHISNDHQGSPVIADNRGINEAFHHQEQKQKV